MEKEVQKQCVGELLAELWRDIVFVVKAIDERELD